MSKMNLMLLENPIATTKPHSSASAARSSYMLNPKGICDACGEKTSRLYALKVGKQKAKFCRPCLNRFWQMQNPKQRNMDNPIGPISPMTLWEVDTGASWAGGGQGIGYVRAKSKREAQRKARKTWWSGAEVVGPIRERPSRTGYEVMRLLSDNPLKEKRLKGPGGGYGFRPKKKSRKLTRKQKKMGVGTIVLVAGVAAAFWFFLIRK